MKRLVAVIAGVLLGVTLTYAATNKPKKLTISNTRIVQADQRSVTVDYAGVKVFVPKGQTLILGQRSDGMLVIRGNNLKNVKIGGATLSSNGFSVMSYQPESKVVVLNRGTDLTVQDSFGTVATIYPGQAASAVDAKVTSLTAPQLQALAKEAALAAEEVVPAFVAESEASEAASEQSTQDVKETETVLSQSTR